MREVEILVELYTDIKAARETMSFFEFQGSKYTVDTYYYDPLRSNLQLNKDNKLMECCRIRNKNNRYFLTYKTDVYDNDIWQYSEEHESEFMDRQAIENILKNLGLRELVVINNVKHTYLNNLFEIVIEEVEGLGNFLEVEYKNNDDDRPVQEIKDEIYSFIQSLKLEIGQELNSGKPELFLLKRRAVSSL